jgi:hypothetical protein
MARTLSGKPSATSPVSQAIVPAKTATVAPATPNFQDIFGVKKADTQAGGFRQNLFNQFKSGEVAMPTANSITSESALQPFINPKTGNSIFDARTGTFKKPGEGINPGQAFINANRTGGALEDARNFDPSQVGDTAGGLAKSQAPQTQEMANQMLGIGAGNMGSGTGYIESALGQFANLAPKFEMSRQNALGELESLQQQALSPELSAGQRAFYQDLADRRRADIDSRFAEGGDIADVFGKQRQSDLAVLQNRGVLDSGTGANTLAARDLGLAGQYNLMRQQANEQDAQGLINERNATRQSATAFGGLQSQQAAQQGNSLLSSLAGISSGGGAIGQLGLGAGSLGVNLGSLANQQQQLDLANRQQAFNEALAALGTNVNAQQTQLGNVFTGRNNYQNLLSLKQQRELNEIMAQMAGASGKTDWSKLIGGVAGGALGALGGPLGSAVGSQVGSGIGGMF